MPLIRTFISPEEVLPDRVVTYEELCRMAATLNRDEALHFIAFLNLLLASAHVETELKGTLEPLRDVQTFVFREIVSKDLLDALQKKLGRESLLDRPILHRSQLLFVARLIATCGDPNGGNKLQTREDFDIIGDLVFLTNGLFRTDEPSSRVWTAVWLASQMGPLHEVENLPKLSLAWPRTADLLAHYIPAASPDPDEIERLERIAVFSSGFSTMAWLDLTWMLFSYWSAVDFRELMKNRSRGYLSLATGHTVVSADVLVRATADLGIVFDELSTHLRIDAYNRQILFDLTPFRQKPLWIVGDQVLCIDPALLVERLGPHLFWSMMNALDTKERRRAFSGIWGKAFEGYALDRLKTIFRAKKWNFVANPIDASTNEELWDAVALRDRVAVIFECKGTFVQSARKYSGVPKPFFQGLTEKFGRVPKGGVYQLVRGLRSVWFRRTASPHLDGSLAVNEVYPVLIVQDPIFLAGPACRVLSDRFNVALERARRVTVGTPPKVWPLAVVTADDLDRVAALVQATGQRLDTVLKMFHRAHPSRMIAFSEFLSSEAKRVGFNESAHELIRQRFRQQGEAAMARFKESEYGAKADD